MLDITFYFSLVSSSIWCTEIAVESRSQIVCNLKFSYTIRSPLYKPTGSLFSALCLLYKPAKTLGVGWVGQGRGASGGAAPGGRLHKATNCVRQ